VRVGERQVPVVTDAVGVEVVGDPPVAAAD